jgi:hypothetical protein
MTAPRLRSAVRAILLDPADRVLLVAGPAAAPIDAGV